MATWVVHLRIADYFINVLNDVIASEFVIGNVSPDCGYGKKDSIGDFEPPPKITHWTYTGSKRDCRYNDFYELYLKDKEKNKAYWFYLGYYIHLITDIMWSSKIYMPTRDKYADEYEKNPEFLKVIKVDWNDLDHKYIRENPNFKAFEILMNNKSVEDYLPYYAKNQLTTQTKYIADYYKANMNREDLDRKYTYLTQEEVDNFINCAIELITLDLSKKNII